MKTLYFDALRIKHLRLLAVLRDTGTIQGAAAHLDISQPAASRMIREMEEAVGCPLFTREHRGVTPTAAGIHLMDKVGIVLEELGYSEFEPRGPHPQAKQLLRIGAISQVVTQILPKALSRMCDREPSLSVSLLDATSRQLLHLLKEGEIDCAIGGFILGDEMRREVYAQELWEKDDRLCVIAHRDNPHFQTRSRAGKKISLADSRSLQWVLPTQGTLLRNVFDAQFVSRGLIPIEPRIESPSPAVIHAFINAHVQLCSISRESVIPLLPADTPIVKIALLEGLELPRLQILIRRNTEKIQSLKRFLSDLKSEIA
ncbi:LysR family transcriptional regulator [Paralcaligenes sp. KSB-10]|uniref:LysR family transcriptional regulator n=1 Tax=Paralcaligenes sp. KSB-10 TaxID=2901142 RepID=UPI001E5D06BD|nr:LysR family transcriptional regulator [Paralcaligenes sp. KSB-10]UHL63205.1 LysR family transcriptional regulator [Paralcaligenes sp. KSB-10]